jgi:uncharacterized protein (UPF0264 family)
MTRLLVSVRSASEALIAVDAGVDLIDLKEPGNGALGAVTTATAAEVVHTVGGRVPLSMALGELREGPKCHVPEGMRWAKLGLAGCAQRDDWREAWRRAAALLPSTCGLVAVIYADFEASGAPPPEAVLREAESLEARAVLVDTAVKNGRGLLDWWTPEAVRRLADEAKRRGMLAVAGGALTPVTIPTVAACGVDYVAVRGAACEGDRSGTISAARIAAIRGLLG